jgi:hypothetical protein
MSTFASITGFCTAISTFDQMMPETMWTWSFLMNYELVDRGERHVGLGLIVGVEDARRRAAELVAVLGPALMLEAERPAALHVLADDRTAARGRVEEADAQFLCLGGGQGERAGGEDDPNSILHVLSSN